MDHYSQPEPSGALMTYLILRPELHGSKHGRKQVLTAANLGGHLGLDCGAEFPGCEGIDWLDLPSPDRHPNVRKWHDAVARSEPRQRPQWDRRP
jgi:hypothetical protein